MRLMLWAGSRLAASWHPTTSSFPHQPVFTASTNPFRFIALHALSSHGYPLPSSFHQLTHSFPSHGTRPSTSSEFSSFYFPISIFPRPLSSFFATLTDSASRNSFVCNSYKNTGVAPISSHFGTRPISPRPRPAVLPRIINSQTGRNSDLAS
jgi:hypothetical protein